MNGPDWAAFILARVGEDELNARDQFGPDESVGTWTAYLLAACAAYRAIVERHSPDEHATVLERIHNADHRTVRTTGRWVPACRACVAFHADMDCENEAYPCPTLRALAAIWADHPDYPGADT